MNDKSIQERLAVIEDVVLRMEARLFGNGQPGEMEHLQNRIRKLESWFWRAAGAVGLAVVLIETLHR
jgi:hypothetical protein